jgi:hypothetical protein
MNDITIYEKENCVYVLSMFYSSTLSLSLMALLVYRLISYLGYYIN